jgi:hypothetical protein
MTRRHELGSPMQASKSGTRLAARWRVLLAHDARAATCDGLYDALTSALGEVEIVDVASVEAARSVLHAARAGKASPSARIDVCLVCLDLPPAPLGGVRLAQSVFAPGSGGPPLVLVTRSQRWLPADASELLRVPWVAPDADPALLSAAIVAALGPQGRAPVAEVADVDGDWEPALKVR